MARIQTERKSQGPVVHACNPSYLRGSDQENQGSMLPLGKKKGACEIPYLSGKNLGIVVHAFHPSYYGNPKILKSPSMLARAKSDILSPK
jgi:hypothetical protein